MPSENPTPVYIFSGFLESGKTTFIQDTLEDPKFNKGEKTLLLVCEEGETEYEPASFSGKNVKTVVLDSIEELNEDNLGKIAAEYRPERIMVEYNGMWQIQNFYDNMPENWAPYQDMLFFDGSTFENYNANMRSLVVDKLSDCDMVVFNRLDKDFDTMKLHKIVRATSRRTEIIYEYKDGSFTADEIEDPLPFDVNAPVIEIEDRDFALFYRDLTENLKNYKDKTVAFKALAATDPKFPDKTCALGRHIMTCCAADITYCGLVSKTGSLPMPVNSSWYNIKAKIDIRFSRLYGKKGPVLNLISMTPAEAPEEQVATFY